MAMKSAILQKKLHELESELSDVFRIPLDPLPGPRHQIKFDDVVKRIEFLKTLLSLEEYASQAQDSDQLNDAGKKIAALEAAFHEWDESRTSALSNFDDTPSICSDCTNAILDDGADSVHGSESTPVSADEDLDGGETCFEQVEKPDQTVDARQEERRIWGRMGNYCRIFASGVIVGAICMGKLSSILSTLDTEAFLPPPT